MLAGPEEATVIGNLLVQAIALGELGSLEDAREVVRRSFPCAPASPREHPSGSEARERFADSRVPAEVGA